MTAEVAVMNRQAVVLAADSAVTAGVGVQRKRWSSASKIFGLSQFHPVGLMVYGASDFMRVPWEIIIKLFRETTADESPHDKLDDYVDRLLSFLADRADLHDSVEQERFFIVKLRWYYGLMRKHSLKRVALRIERASTHDISASEVADCFESVISEHHGRLVELPIADGLLSDDRESSPTVGDLTNALRVDSRETRPTLADISDDYAEIITAIRRLVFPEMRFSAETTRKLEEIAWLIIERGVRSPSGSGVVIAGYGKTETFPVVQSLAFEGVAGSRLIYLRAPRKEITRDHHADLQAYAQDEDVQAFLGGVTPHYQRLVESLLGHGAKAFLRTVVSRFMKGDEHQRGRYVEILERAFDTAVMNFKDTLSERRRERYSTPIMDVIAVLPKGDLAVMAENLVSLTAFRQKVSMQPETVADPIDVAVISRGDGFVWIKRKHYFDIVQNPHFLSKYQRADGPVLDRRE